MSVFTQVSCFIHSWLKLEPINTCNYCRYHSMHEWMLSVPSPIENRKPDVSGCWFYVQGFNSKFRTHNATYIQSIKTDALKPCQYCDRVMSDFMRKHRYIWHLILSLALQREISMCSLFSSSLTDVSYKGFFCSLLKCVNNKKTGPLGPFGITENLNVNHLQWGGVKFQRFALK